MRRGACGAVRAALTIVSVHIVAAGLVATAPVGEASAADVAREPFHYTVGAYSWSGPYLGVNLGYQGGATSNNPTRPTGVVGGAQAGYNWQTGQFVLGGEADIQLSSASDTFAPWKFSNPWFGSARARVGFALNQVLLYGTLGVAFGGISVAGAGLTESKIHTGWTGGGGVELGITSNVSAKVDYLFVDLSDRAYTLVGSSAIKSHLVRLGFNYRF
jgi:outer membrane immunogenic protein